MYLGALYEYNRGRQTSTGVESNGRSSSEHDSTECVSCEISLTGESTPIAVVHAPSVTQPPFSNEKRTSSTVTVSSFNQCAELTQYEE